MGAEPAGIDFALLGHQESWAKIAGSVEVFTGGARSLSEEQLAGVYTFVPPRVLFDVEMRSITGKTIRGSYIETFIAPDELGQEHWRKNVRKVLAAAEVARKVGAKVASMGGFTSIVLEGKSEILQNLPGTSFTTGNTLTAAFIVKGMEKACLDFDKPLHEQSLLIIGATGDIGRACVSYFSGQVKKLLLCARNKRALAELSGELKNGGLNAPASTDLRALLPQADLIITVSSSAIEDFDASLCKEGVIISDAGYPKNLVVAADQTPKGRIFCGGMGQVKAGFTFDPTVGAGFYNFPVKNVAHGCLLEAAVLAFEGMEVGFSKGRGNITVERMEVIYGLAGRHGMTEVGL